jgi:hypothetical protein
MQTLKLSTQVLLEPRQAFRSLLARPSCAAPLLAIVVCTLAAYIIYFQVVDFPWLVDALLNGDPRTAAMPQDERMKAAAMFSRQGMLMAGALGVMLGIPVLRLVEAAWYLVAGRATGVALSFRHWLSLTAVPLMFLVLASHSNGQLTLEQLQIASLNEVFFHLPPGHRWFALLSNLTLFQPWCWWLAAQAVREWTGRSWTYSIVITMAPVVVVYGAWSAAVFTTG